MLNTLNKTEIEGSFLNKIKNTHRKSTTNVMVSIKRLNVFPCMFSNGTKISIYIHPSTGSCTNCKELKREMTVIQHK